MSENRQFMFGLLVIILSIAIFFGGCWTGETVADSLWEEKIVDDPAGIAVIRSRVLAERAEEDYVRQQTPEK